MISCIIQVAKWCLQSGVYNTTMIQSGDYNHYYLYKGNILWTFKSPGWTSVFGLESIGEHSKFNRKFTKERIDMGHLIPSLTIRGVADASNQIYTMEWHHHHWYSWWWHNEMFKNFCFKKLEHYFYYIKENIIIKTSNDISDVWIWLHCYPLVLQFKKCQL